MFIADDKRCPHCGQILGFEEELKAYMDRLMCEPAVLELVAKLCDVIEQNAIPLDEFFDKLKSDGQ